MAEELAFEQCSGNAAQLTAISAPAARDVAEVDRLGHELLAGAGFARDENGARRRSRPARPARTPQSCRGRAQQVVVGRFSLKPAAQIGDLVDQAAILSA